MGLFVACNTPSSSKFKRTKKEPSKQIKNSYEQRVSNYQDSVSAVYASGANDVLEKKDVSTSTKLDFFPPNQKFRIRANFIRIEGGESFEMATSTDRLPVYTPYGKLSFKLDNKDLELTLYQSKDYPESLFCPFKDLTNGNESYGAGRYLDFDLADTIHPIVDFNYCYNPYCAYNPNFSCPIPPVENHLKVSIEAGVKKWH